MAPAAEDYKIIPNPDPSELLRYHLQVTDRIDRENEVRRHELALANLKTPPVYPVHQHAPISHAAQQTPENPNNIRAAQRHEEAKTEIAADDLLTKQLTEEEQDKNRRAMQAQIAAAAGRKTEQPAAEVTAASVGNGGGTQAPAPAAAPAPAKPVSAIPEWPPKG